MLEARIAQNAPPLETIPETYNPLIAKLVHERSALIHCKVFGLMIYGTVTKPFKHWPSTYILICCLPISTKMTRIAKTAISVNSSHHAV